jgi:3-oxoacyl-[acyl-carrier protein] reductase
LKLLEGLRALVTGGARGLGRGLCQVFAAEGARVAFTYARDEAAAAETLESLGPAAKAYRVSVTDAEATASMVEEVERDIGGIDILVNNAGVTHNLPLALLEVEDFERALDVNVKGTFITSKAVLRFMVRRKSGVILNIGSLAGARMIDAPIHYCTSKGGIKAMTEALAKEVARHGIRVICLAPGLLEHGMGRNLPEHRLADYLRHCALGRVGTFAEMGRFAALLVSERNTYMTGETIVFDGGVT